MTRQVHRILEPEPLATLGHYIAAGGGRALDVARNRPPDDLIELIERSGLRGRGGAGFPTGRKWRTVAASRAQHGPPTVVVNAAEGEPGTFKDRLLIRRNPYLILEGACVAAIVMGTDRIVVATKATFRIEAERLHQAVKELAAEGWTDDLDIVIFEGPDEYLYGEETGLLEAIGGHPPFPRVAPPYRRGLGRPLDGPTALVDNVETLANIPGIVGHGADWFRSVGTDHSTGTIICTVTGDTRRHGVGEFPMGTPLRTVLAELGGISGGIAAVLSGVSNPPLGPAHLDEPVSYEHLSAAGSGLGSASFIVIGTDTDLRSVAAGVARFLSIESCGQCEPCKRDSLALADRLSQPASADQSAARANDPDVTVTNLLATVARGARCSLAGQTERVVGGLLALAGRSPGDGSEIDVYPILPLVDIEGDLARLDTGHVDKRPDWTYDRQQPDAGLWPVQRLLDQPVEITLARTEELDEVAPLDGPEPVTVFAVLRRHDEELGRRCQQLRRAAGAVGRHAVIDDLHLELDRHTRTTQGLIYPLIARLAPELDDDLTWYPARHERHAAAVLDQLQTGAVISARQADEVCAAVHVATRELEERIIPCLERALRQRPEVALEIDRDMAELLGEV